MRGKKKDLYEKHFRVTIFGSARIKKNNQAYKEVYAIAKAIAVNNIDIVTGGGPGLMHAANKGHIDGSPHNPSHSWGLVIKLPSEEKANRHLDIKKQFTEFSQRLDQFMDLSNVVIIAPGGIGTMLELLYTWQLIQVHKRNIPIILFGDMWQDFIEWMKRWPLKKRLISKEDFDLIHVVNSREDALKVVNKYHKIFLKKHKHHLAHIKHNGI